MRTEGFTLIELMITLIISAIVSTFAYTSYNNYIVKIRRNDGKIALLDLSIQMEKYFFYHNTYATATIATHTATDIKNTNLSDNGFYHMSIIKQNNHFYTLQTTAIGIQYSYDSECKILTLDNFGAKKPLSCWNN